MATAVTPFASDRNEFRFLNLLGANQKPRREKHDGRDYLVVPVVALVEGVVRAMGAKSHELVRAEKFKAISQSWNNRPIFAGHPVEKGVPISGNDQRILERSFGMTLNAATDDKRLLMEAWLDIEKAKSMPESARVLERCFAHERGDADAKPIEVSTGSLVGMKKISGVYNGKSYAGEWDTIMPDHLAMLAEDKVGACSVAMGCGALRAAMVEEGGLRLLEGEEEITMALTEMRAAQEPPKSLRERVREFIGKLKSQGLRAAAMPGPGEEQSEMLAYQTMLALLEQCGTSYDDVRKVLQDMIAAEQEDASTTLENPMEEAAEEEVEAAQLASIKAYCMQMMGTLSGILSICTSCQNDDMPGMMAMLDDFRAAAGKRHSSTDEEMIQKVHDHSVDLGASCVAQRNAATHECACRKNNQPGETNMDRSKTIAALAAHPHSAIKDTATLEKASDETLKALQDSAAATEATVTASATALKAAKDGQATAEVALKAAQDALAAPVTEERLPQAYRDLMAERNATEAAETTELVTTLKAAQSAWTEDDLKKMALPELRKLSSALKVAKPSFNGRVVPRAAAAETRSYAPPDPYKAGLEIRAAGK